MKILNLFAIIFLLTSCQPSKEEVAQAKKRMHEKQKADSVAADSMERARLIAKWGPRYEERVDSANKANEKLYKKKAKEEAAALKKKYGKKAWAIFEKHGWDINTCKDIADHKYWIGMSLDMLVASRGRPDNINRSNYGSGENYQYCWYDYTPSCFYAGPNKIVKSYN